MSWFKNAGAAVDAFFMISGFVICQNYQGRIHGTYRFAAFIRARFNRLAPLNACGAIIGLLSVLVLIKIGNQSELLTYEAGWQGFLLALFFIPNFNSIGWPYGPEISIGGLFPLNLPAWSLFYELVAYACFYYICKWVRSIIVISGLWLIVTLCYLALCILYISDSPGQGANPGWDQATLWLGISRVLFGFFTGVLIQTLTQKSDKIISSGIGFVLTGTALALLMVGGVWLSVINTFVFMPLTIVFLVSLKFTNTAQKIATLIGELSYPLYITHIPIATLVYVQFNYIKILSPSLQILSLLVIAITIAYYLNKYDKLIRRYLNNKNTTLN